MALTPWDDFSVFRRPGGGGGGLFRDEDWQIFDPFREEFFKNQPMTQQRAQAFAPLMTADLIEKENEYNIHCDLPGVDPAEIDLSIHNRMVTIKAERKNVHESTTDKVHTLERSYGTVQRKIRLPENADMDHASSTYKNGVLNISFPKLATPQGSRKIQITTH